MKLLYFAAIYHILHLMLYYVIDILLTSVVGSLSC